MQRILSLALLCGLSFLSGCSAIASRTLVALGPSPQPPLYFGGIRSDYNIIHAKSTQDSWFWRVYCSTDAAFSFGADILIIPYDIHTACQWSQRSNSGPNYPTP
jgi:uncharacterized protein YceK